MASISQGPRTGNILIRAYAGINPTTKKDRTISTTLPSHASKADIEKAVAELDAKAAILKKKASLMTISSTFRVNQSSPRVEVTIEDHNG